MAYPELNEKAENRLDTPFLSLNPFFLNFVCLDIQDFSPIKDHCMSPVGYCFMLPQESVKK